MYDDIKNEYFEWLSETVCGTRFSKNISYRKLLMHLHRTKFKHVIPRDKNRAEDGVELRYRFAWLRGYEDYILDDLNGRCSVLEMMVGLAVRCEETIMSNPEYGDRTGQWFWEMITNLGLGACTDDNFDKEFVTDVITRFLKRDYAPDGRGGLFTIKDSEIDLRELEIWTQLNWYLDSFL